MSPLDASCHHREGLLQFLRLAHEDRLRRKFMNANRTALSYDAMRALLDAGLSDLGSLHTAANASAPCDDSVHWSESGGAAHGFDDREQACLYASCRYTLPTLLGVDQAADQRDQVPPLRVDYVLGSAALLDRFQVVECGAVHERSAQRVSDHFPVRCALRERRRAGVVIGQ